MSSGLNRWLPSGGELHQAIEGFGVYALIAVIQQCFQARVARATHRQSRAVAKNRQAAVLPVWFDSDDPFKIDDVGPVNANKSSWIKPGLDAGDSLLLQMLGAVSCQGHVVVLRFHVVQLGDRNQRHPRAIRSEER